MDFTQSRLYGISNKKYLSELLHIDLAYLKNVDEYYSARKFYKNSRSGKKVRELYNPTDEHKRILKRIVRLLYQIDFPDYLCGGVQGKSYVTNAGVHINNGYLLQLDISNFFPSTNDSYVYDFFRNRLNTSPDIAKILTNLTTEKKDQTRILPQGYATSPILSYLSYFSMYEELSVFAQENNMAMSAYYDDFTFSSPAFIHKAKKREVIKIIEKYGLQINSSKSKLSICNYSKVTGVIVNDGELKVPKSIFKTAHELYMTLRKMDSEYAKNIPALINCCNQLQGYISVILSIDPDRNVSHYQNYLKYIRKKCAT